MRKTIILFFILMSLTISCQDKKQIRKENINDNQLLNIEGHTFYRVTQTGKNLSLYQPCDANIEKYIVYHDSIFHDLGQEFYTFKISKHEISNNKYKYLGGYFFGNTVTNKEALTFEVLDGKKYWKINNQLFIDSLYANTIPRKEQSCKECYDGCDAKKKTSNDNSIIYGNWSLDCDGPIGITIKENEMIICVEPNSYYIHLTKINENTDDKILKFKLNRFEGVGSKDVYSESYINDNEIAVIKILENNKIEFNWLGFYNKVNKERQYTDPVISNDNPVILGKCD